MFRFLNKSKFLYSPDDIGGPPADGGIGKDEVIDFLNKDDKEDDEILDLTPPKDKAADKDKKPADADVDDDADDKDDEEDDTEAELKALEEELEDPTDEQLELTTPVRRQEILKKYPNLFKDFPYLEKAYYREQQFTEITPTIEDAREAVEAREALNKFEADLMKGDVSTILGAIREQDQNSFYQIVDNLLPMLARVDEGAYHHLMGNTTKHIVLTMLQEAKKSNNETLQSAAQILYQFTFGTSEWQPVSKLAKEGKPEDNGKTTDLQRREQEFTQRKFNDAKTDLNSRFNNTLKATIDAHIDPRGSMTEYVKKQAVREVQESLATLISQDKRFITLTDKLWEAAFKDGFSKSSVERIRSAYLSKSRTLLPTVIKKARNEALRGMGKRVVEDKEDSGEKDTSRQTERSHSKDRSDKTTRTPGEIPKGMRTLDFLNKD